MNTRKTAKAKLIIPRPLTVEVIKTQKVGWKHAQGRLAEASCWYFRVRAGNGRILCHSEQYNKRGSCINAVRALVYCPGGVRYRIEGVPTYNLPTVFGSNLV